MLKIHPFLEILFMSAIGAAFAVAIDFWVAADGALLRRIAGFADMLSLQRVSYSAPLHFVAAALILFGAGSTFYFRPLSGKGAFACGFGAISALAIFFP